MTQASPSGLATAAAAPVVGGTTVAITVNDYSYRGTVKPDGSWSLKRWLSSGTEASPGTETLGPKDLNEIPSRVLIAIEDLGGENTKN